jgi:hypothetical protein
MLVDVDGGRGVSVVCALVVRLMCVISLRLEKRVILSNGSDGTMECNLLLPDKYYPVVFLQNVTATATSEDMVGRYKGVPVLTPWYIHSLLLPFVLSWV